MSSQVPDTHPLPGRCTHPVEGRLHRLRGCVAAASMTEALGKNVIHISIHQESSLSYLFKALGQSCLRKEAAPKAAPKPSASLTKNRCSGAQKALGGIQILLGIVCISLGAVLAYKEFSPDRIFSGAAFWMGGLFVVSGIFSVLSGTFGSYWVGLATVFNLASVVAGCVALTQGIVPIPHLNADFENQRSFCEATQPQPWNMSEVHPYRSWESSRRTEEREREAQCERVLWKLLNIAIALRILLLIYSVVAIAMALFCFACNVRVLYQRLKASCDIYVPFGDQEIPPPSENQASTEHTA